jgi:peptidoglycan/xylan/chitin deacetylase (PgdA/CDA1 family)
MTHPVLSTLNRNEQQKEIAGSKKRLEEIIGHEITSFAYPYGTRADYDQTSIDVVRETGFQRACSNFGGALHKSTDPFQLPRFLVRDYGGEEFQINLREWLRA